MATVIIEDLIRSRCGYCLNRRSDKGVDVATVYTEGLRKG